MEKIYLKKLLIGLSIIPKCLLLLRRPILLRLPSLLFKEGLHVEVLAAAAGICCAAPDDHDRRSEGPLWGTRFLPCDDSLYSGVLRPSALRFDLLCPSGHELHPNLLCPSSDDSLPADPPCSGPCTELLRYVLRDRWLPLIGGSPAQSARGLPT